MTPKPIQETVREMVYNVVDHAKMNTAYTGGPGSDDWRNNTQYEAESLTTQILTAIEESLPEEKAQADRPMNIQYSDFPEKELLRETTARAYNQALSDVKNMLKEKL